MQAVLDSLQYLHIGNESDYGNLTMFPLLNEYARQPNYITLEDALTTKSARVTEVSEGGSVRELQFVNECDQPVLLLDGEELIGAKQNRVLNLTILAPARSTLTVPVSCVEAGRWADQSTSFAASPSAQYAEGRARRMAQVSESLHSTGRRESDELQSTVWADIARKSHRLASESSTQAMSAIYERHEHRVEEFVRAFQTDNDQIGGIFAINGRCIGCDLFDSPVTLHKLLPKLIRSYALDALDPDAPKPVLPSRWSAEAWLRAMTAMETESYRAVGMGDDVRFRTADLIGAALVVDGTIVHLSAHHLVLDGTVPTGRI